jgi:site-specific recombinase XerD
LFDLLVVDSIDRFPHYFRNFGFDVWGVQLFEGYIAVRFDVFRPADDADMAGRDVEHDELDALLAVCAADPRPAGARDAAIIALAYLSGCRRAEIAILHLADLDLNPPSIRVVGKGGKQRLVPLSPTATPHLATWLA